MCCIEEGFHLLPGASVRGGRAQGQDAVTNTATRESRDVTDSRADCVAPVLDPGQ